MVKLGQIVFFPFLKFGAFEYILGTLIKMQKNMGCGGKFALLTSNLDSPWIFTLEKVYLVLLYRYNQNTQNVTNAWVVSCIVSIRWLEMTKRIFA